MGDVVILLPGILGSVLTRDGKDVWAPSAGAVGRALWSLGRSMRTLQLEDDPPERDELGDGVVASRLVPDVHLIPGLWGIDGYSGISRDDPRPLRRRRRADVRGVPVRLAT